MYSLQWCTEPNTAREESMQSNAETYITLTQAGNIAPGRPSTNCLWRWCRRGVKSRNGEKVRLRHIRIGGKIFTTRRWLDVFGQQLAEADARYFELSEAARGTTSRSSRHRRNKLRADPNREREIEAAAKELEEAGI
jgi:hypothetical protein